MSKDFSAQIAEFNKKVKRRLHTVMQEATQDVISTMQTPVGNGGRLPVDTGFLRASLVAAIDQLPKGESQPDGSVETYMPKPDAVAAVLLRLKPGETFYAGYVAEYARAMEYRYGFVRGAAEQWEEAVNRAVRKVIGR